MRRGICQEGKAAVGPYSRVDIISGRRSGLSVGTIRLGYI